MRHELITQLVGYSANLRHAHWQAPTRTNEHAALGALYDSIDDLTDSLAEVAFGKDGNRTFADGCINIATTTDYPSLVASGLEICAAIRSDLTPGQDDDLLNIVADISSAINLALYKLQ